eukprot:11172828-Karenia_brevis.AAC.1
MKYYHEYVVAYLGSVRHHSVCNAKLDGELLKAIDGSGGAKLKDASGNSGPASWAFCVFHRSPSDDMSFLESIGGT